MTEIQAQIQKDLDDGKFGRICSNETTFKEYVFPLINSHTTSLLEKVAEDIKELFKDVEAREDRVEVSDALSIIRSYKKHE